MSTVNIIFNGPKYSEQKIILAHGAGAPMNSEFMNYISEGIGNKGFRVIRFNFKYMEKAQISGKRRPPSPVSVLTGELISMINSIGGNNLFVGGKSMGGRVASMVTDASISIRGVICLGYPFHPSGKPEKLRTSHLTSISMPVLICQGERDSLGGYAEVQNLKLSKLIKFHWLKDGNHSFKPRKLSGLSEKNNLDSAISEIIKFVKVNSRD